MSADELEPVDILICGGGSAGAALAGLVARRTGLSILLCEAGPDFGSFTNGGWPPELLDARRIPATHDWGYGVPAHPAQTDRTEFRRARVIGGCSSVNGCVALAGHQHDYDGWRAAGNPGWEWEAVATAFARASQALRIRIPSLDELTPFHSAFLEACLAAGFPYVRDLDDFDARRAWAWHRSTSTAGRDGTVRLPISILSEANRACACSVAV